MNSIIEVKNLNFMYDNNIIFKEVNFFVNKGDFISVIGANGTGKTSFFKILLGELKTNSLIKWFGKDLCHFNDFYKIGYVSQNYNDNINRFPASVSEIVTLSLYKEIGLFKFPNKNHKKKVLDALKIVDMQNFEKELFYNLSGGQKQRVMLAKSIVNNPEIILLDEPLTGLDSDSIDLIYSLLYDLNKKGITILMINHDLENSKKLAKKSYIIEDKKLKILEGC